MGLFDGIENDLVKGPPCGIAATLPKLDDEDRDALLRVLADKTIPGSVIRRRLEAAGYKIGPTTVQRHRTGACRCKA